MEAAMEAKLREMLDRHEIWQVILRYCRGLDRFDREMVRSCYFDDAVEDHDNYVGRPDDFIDWANMTSGSFVNSRHGVSNHRCELAGDDAYCETYYMFTGVAQTPPHAMSVGRYIDHFQRRDGEWRIANRVTVIEGNFQLMSNPVAEAFEPMFPRETRPPSTRDRTDVSYQRPPQPRQPPGK